jgi:glucose dehydrogenase
MKLNSLDPSIETGYNTSYTATVPTPAGHLGQPEAIDVTTGKTLWRLERETPLYGMLTTAGGLLFAADTNRRFHAIDQWTLWQTILNGASDMAPISFAVDDKQYIAVFAPSGTQAAAQHAGQLGLSANTGVSNVGHTLFVFSLP